MKKILERKVDAAQIRKLLSAFPVTAILGPRQCGKTVLARQCKYNHYFDLENPTDLARLDTPKLALENLKGLIVIDEIQRIPELFQFIRYLVDTNEEQQYLILGSASNELIRQSSESLAGRIAYHYLGGFSLTDVGKDNVDRFWLTGSYPRAYLAPDIKTGFLWLKNYISTFLERDIPQLGIRIPSRTLLRFWTMLSHYHAQILNYSEIGRSFGLSDMTVRHYIDILHGTFMIRVLQPWHTNTKKRLVKRPKIYLRDSGIFHSLMSIESQEVLLSHNKLGASWEGFALECVSKSLEKRAEELYFWSTHSGAEVDLFWQHEGKNWAIEFKYSDAPKKTRSMETALRDLDLAHLWVVYPGSETYRISPDITAIPLKNIPAVWNY